jgi:hypothetical protein
MEVTDLIKKLYDLNFTTNTFADKKHEKLVKKVFKSFGMTKTDDVEAIKILKYENNINKVVNELVGKFIFIEQPFGSQNSPDFIVCMSGFILWIECKSGKNKITWNSGYPRKEILYVFSCKKKNTTTVFLGSLTELWEKNPNFDERYDNFDRKKKESSKKEFSDEFQTENFSFYPRRMLIDTTKYSHSEIRDNFYKGTLEVFSNL